MTSWIQRPMLSCLYNIKKYPPIDPPHLRETSTGQQLLLSTTARHEIFIIQEPIFVLGLLHQKIKMFRHLFHIAHHILERGNELRFRDATAIICINLLKANHHGFLTTMTVWVREHDVAGYH